jgi:hypothetical protein
MGPTATKALTSIEILPIQFHHSLKIIWAQQDLKTHVQKNEARKVWKFLSPTLDAAPFGN